ncbi:hypothetical protein [Aureimonas sp. D3]|uniref:hypothetical protein n=1 Tax=Aureimonas sp. D3 TaxID=1638164 RepID=UPI0007845EBA|nr:hypothetical protein [Aureimonas sp. D3]
MNFAQVDSEASRFLTALSAAGWAFHRTDLEEAFRALVGWPGYAAIPNINVEQREDLLAGVCRALIALNDKSAMPSDIFRIVMDESDGMGGSSYADGALSVLNCPRIFANLKQEGR